MICQSCGECVPMHRTCIVDFTGNALPFFPVNAKWIACDKCAHEIYLDCYSHFSSEIVNRCLKVYYAVKENKKW